MPYPNEHAARMTDPSKYKSFARQNGKGGPGVDFIFGVLPDSKTELQAVRFDEKKYTPAEAKKWLTDNKMDPMSFEAAKEIKKSEDFLIDLSVVNVIKSNDRFYYELGYMLDASLGNQRSNVVLVDGEIDDAREFARGSIVKAQCASVEPVRHVNGKFGFNALNVAIIEANTDRKSPESAKAIIQKADYLGRLIASDFTLMDLSEADIVKRAVPREMTYEVKGDEASIQYDFPIYKDAAKQLVYGVVYEPFTGANHDTDGDFATAEEIEKAAHRFMDTMRDGAGGSNFMHMKDLPEKTAKVCESYVAPADFLVNGQMIRKGSWVVVTKIEDASLWDMINQGFLTGYSMEGTGRTSDLVKRAGEKSKSTISKRCLFDMVIKSVALVDRGANRKRFFLMKREKENIAMNKETIIAFVKSAKLDIKKAEELATAAGLNDADKAEVVKEAGPVVETETTEQVIEKAVKATADVIMKACATAIEEALKKADPVVPPPPAPNADKKDVAYYLAHPEEEVPEEMVQQVLDAVAAKQGK